jgi:hypothetical protein
MEFHEPDSRWYLYNCKSFEQYLEKFLVRGNFHKGVPKDIVDAFKTVENLIAHAYYYYPMYDEALSKVLRTIEMAVRIKCKELDIKTESKKKNGQSTPIPLGQLIMTIAKAEPEKELDHSLDSFRYLRNSHMHPERNSYMGGLIIPTIIRSVNSLNELFAPTTFFTNRTSLLNSHKFLIDSWCNKVLEIQMTDYYFIAHNIEILDIFPSGDRLDVCLYVQPVPKLPDYEDGKHGFRKALSFNVSQLEFHPDKITATNNIDSAKIIITCSHNVDHVENTKLYLEYLDRFHRKPISGNAQLIQHDKYKDIAYFQYNHYHLIQ